MNIYVGNLSYKVDEEDLTGIFGEYGDVSSVKLIKDKFTGSSKGFGFIEMANAEEGQNAIAELNNAEIDGRKVKVNEAKEREDNPGFNRNSGGGGNFSRNNNSGGGGYR